MKGRYGWSALALLVGTSGYGFAQDLTRGTRDQCVTNKH